MDNFVLAKKAISDKNVFREIFYLDKALENIPGFKTWVHQLGTVDKNHILKHFPDSPETIEPYIVSEQIECVTLEKLFEEYKIEKIDLLHIDAEGHDYEILSKFDFEKWRTPVILLEHKHLGPEHRKQAGNLLIENRYKILQLKADWFCYREELRINERLQELSFVLSL